MSGSTFGEGVEVLSWNTVRELQPLIPRREKPPASQRVKNTLLLVGFYLLLLMGCVLLVVKTVGYDTAISNAIESYGDTGIVQPENIIPPIPETDHQDINDADSDTDTEENISIPIPLVTASDIVAKPPIISDGIADSLRPTWLPTSISIPPSISPTEMPSKKEIVITMSPSEKPTANPSQKPSIKPSMTPTNLIYQNGDDYWDRQTRIPTRFPSRYPSRHPSHIPTQHPSRSPTRGSDDYWEEVAEGKTWSDDYWAKKERGEENVNVVVNTEEEKGDDATDDYWNKRNVPTKSPSRYPSRTPTRYPSRIPTINSNKIEEDNNDNNSNNNNVEEEKEEEESSYNLPEASDVTPSTTLADGWLSQIDPTSGRTFYVNLSSGVSQWEPPVDSSEPGDLPTGWLSLKDPTTGKTYYANTKTGVTQWEFPTQSATTPTTMTSSLAQFFGGTNSGSITTSTSKTSPIESVTLPLPAGVPALPVGWIVLADESSGKAYYVNTKTGTSQWDPPTPPTTANDGTLGITPTPPLAPTPPITPSTTATNALLLPPVAPVAPGTTTTTSKTTIATLPAWTAVDPTIAVTTADTTASLPMYYTSRVDKTGRTYYVDTRTGASQWTFPVAADVAKYNSVVLSSPLSSSSSSSSTSSSSLASSSAVSAADAIISTLTASTTPTPTTTTPVVASEVAVPSGNNPTSETEQEKIVNPNPVTPLTATLQPLNGATNRPSLAKTPRPTAISWELQQSHPTWLPTSIPQSNTNNVIDTEALFLQNEEQAQAQSITKGGADVPIIPGVTPLMESSRPGPLPGTILSTGGNANPVGGGGGVVTPGQGLASTSGPGLTGNNGITTTSITDGVSIIPGVPTEAPSMIPPPRTFAPSQSHPPTHFPTEHPSVEPTFYPSRQPTAYHGPTRMPTLYPTRRPTREPTTALPSFSPTPLPTRIPTGVPSRFPISVAFTQAVGKDGPKSGPKVPINADADEENYLLTFLGTRVRKLLRGSSSSSSSSSSSVKKS